MLVENVPRPKVNVFSAGDHYHAESGEAAELIEHVLVRCGYTKPIEWECRIDKLKHCSPESRVLRVVGWKPFGVTLRVKPTSNATIDQQMTLLIPQSSGYSASNLFEQLKGVEKSVSRTWRHEMKKDEIKKPQIQLPWMVREEKKELPVANSRSESPLPELSSLPKNEPSVTFKNLKGIVNDSIKLKFVLENLYAIEKENIKSKKEFIKKFMELCGWKDFLPRICSRMISELARFEYIMETVNERGKITGYILAPRGLAVLGKPVSGRELKKPTQLPVLTLSDFTSLLLESQEKVQELADVSRKLNANALKRAELKQQLQLLDEEDKELLGIITQNQETYETLRQLNNIIVLLPCQGKMMSKEN